jgi:hypothetical protein
MAIVPVGGPSTVNGVLYQLLGSLATLGGFRAVGQQLAGGQLEQLTLILEPSKGGDQQALFAGKRVVTQLKARSTGGTWSLQEIIRDVLPDLYLSVDDSEQDTVYRFVTEGRRGDWGDVEEFFRTLPAPPEGSDILLALDDATELAFGRRSPASNKANDRFWEPGPYTPRTLFRKIVDTLRQRTLVAAEPYEVTWRKTWQLLRGF